MAADSNRDVRRRVVVYATRGVGDARELLVFRQPGDPGAGTQVPAGGIEPGESIDHAARRELREETGLEASAVTQVGRLQELHPNGSRCDNVYVHVDVDAAPDEWSHVLSNGADDAGLTFDCSFLALADVTGSLHDSQHTFLASISPDILPVLRDGVVELRAPVRGDAAALVAEQDDEVVRWLTGRRLGPAKAVAWIDGVQESWHDGTHRRNFVVVEAETGALVGGIESHTDTSIVAGIEPGDANIGYWIGPSGRGQGYAVRAVSLIAEFLASAGVERAVIRTRHDNLAANEVARRAGFTRMHATDDDLARWHLDLADARARLST